MNKKKDLFEELNINKEKMDFCNPLDIDIQNIKRKVNTKIDSAYTERNNVIMKSKKKISLIAAAATLVLGVSVFAASGIVSEWFSSSSSTPDYIRYTRENIADFFVTFFLKRFNRQLW